MDIEKPACESPLPRRPVLLHGRPAIEKQLDAELTSRRDRKTTFVRKNYRSFPDNQNSLRFYPDLIRHL